MRKLPKEIESEIKRSTDLKIFNDITNKPKQKRELEQLNSHLDKTLTSIETTKAVNELLQY